MLMPIGLRCESMHRPLNVAAARPRLSWRLKSSGAGARDERQTAYRILAAASLVELDHDEGPLWDSGKIESSQTIHIPYEGQALAASQQVWWKVRIWDAQDHPSPWSDCETWTMSLLSPADWCAKWIGANADAYRSTALPIFRRAVRCDQLVTRALVYLCGLGHYELHINGSRVGEDVLDPGWTNYARTCLYAVHDITPLVHQGENVIGVMLGNGMYNVTGGRYRKFKGSFGPPKLILQAHIDFADGSSETLVSDGSWRASPGPITFSCIYGGEDYDARLEQRGWDSPGFDDRHWQPVSVIDGPGGTLRPQTAPPVRVMKTYVPIHVTRPAENAAVYDLGQNFSGWPKVTASGPAGAPIKLITGELLDDAGLVSQKNTGSPVSFSYTLCGEENENYHPRFSYTGFRYLQVETEPAVNLSVEGQFLHSSAPVVGHFACSNPLFNQIHALILAAMRSNLQSVLTDCPHREKLGWLEQAHLMGPSLLCNFDLSQFFAKVCGDMRDAQHDDGCMPTIAPEYLVFKDKWADFSNSPEWGSACVMVPWLVYQRYLDRQILIDNFEMMRKYVDYLHSREEEGLICFGLGDWYDIGPGEPGFSKLTSKALTGTAIYCADLEVLRKTAEVLDLREVAKRYRDEARRIGAAFNAKCFDPSTGRYDRGSQTAQAMPMALGLVEVHQYARFAEHLIADIRAHDNHITAGDIGFPFVLKALAGRRSDVIFDVLSRTDPPSYGSQLARGATTLTEAWDANPKNSQNHLMLGHADLWFYESLAGIHIDLSRASGEQIVIRPAPVGDVVWAEAKQETILGTVMSRWERKGDGFELDVTIPPNCEANVCVRTDSSRYGHRVRSGSHSFKARLFDE